MLGFTKQEQLVVLFLLVTLLIGATGRVYQELTDDGLAESLPDSTFTARFRSHFDEIRRDGYAGVDTPAGSIDESGAVLSGFDAGSGLRINLNTATASELQSIPNIGPVLAGKIVDFRKHSGGFNSINDLISVNGIGKVTLKKIRPYLTLE
jgi:competence ComEA-like helix-hairpin-helix protein